MNPQLAGIEDLPGTYPFDVRQSVRALRLNRFFWRMREQAWRNKWLADRAAAYDEAGLTEAERALVDRQDWIGLIRHGVCFFVLEKFARVVGVSNLAMYAAMRGETLEVFLATRRVPAAA
ncbi:protocatechuate 3,4-dioxygenase [Trinickia caryophylli]|uniref:Protocatechuate 4,5-dioxygenase alpha subunit n=1 Tax=Trinickia caryophylli TaxID=28094 RepID=A0A1X7FCR8_TRICW|nr:protocatechuate 3,4-dioxygenase [Trinickia caryophylli]PMS10869.1 protocatechuate 3,4-dioxygenase [Trinickia caryophylli]TRX18812.1 protocatechuate 3,4-dioxygenase [Trinickia caryophylli]WQE10389.1 protocatechuate 3,4-dioxygenase [Trinickia caryophylli]SMF49998.1 protocatechuate 4,5-dioxygenase alpha subunit [Trinickia caryophylli]GLU34161.1 protocatechuate 4,5-dioxygenase subunit alpha [Trinickia caryophylli]